MILIKTKDNLINFNNLLNIFISSDGDRILILQRLDATETIYELYRNENRELLKKVYITIQNQIINLNNENRSGCVNIDYIAEKLENNAIPLTYKSLGGL